VAIGRTCSALAFTPWADFFSILLFTLDTMVSGWQVIAREEQIVELD
jgi:hypothetical protein